MKIIAFIILLIVVIIFSYLIYSNATKNDENILKDKVVTEIKYLEVKLVNIANRMNNITTQNYKVTSKEVEEESGTSSSSNLDSESGQDLQSQDNGESKESSSSSEESKENSSLKDSSGGEQKVEEFNMEEVKELPIGEEEINWDEVLKEIEEIYTIMPTITLDLYQTNVNQEDILNFNTFLDELAIVAKNKEEENTLNKICEMYANISKFIDNTTEDDAYKTTIKTKENVLKGYTAASFEKWDETVANIQNGIDIFSALLTNTNIENEKQVNINRAYVIINELKNAANKQDKDIFFIKYKNLLEEMNSM